MNKKEIDHLRIRALRLREAADHLDSAATKLEEVGNLDLGRARIEADASGASVTLLRRRAPLGRSKSKPGPKPKKAGKRRLSEAGRLAISRAAKKRWAAHRKAAQARSAK